jgi:hypothetical protein
MACGKLLDTAEFAPVEDCSRLRSSTADIGALQVNNFRGGVSGTLSRVPTRLLL